MVNLVLVSHSHKLAKGIVELISPMTADKITVAIAAGIDDPNNPIGTNPIAVLDAIQSVYTDDGILILVDIGSAILSAETALELLKPEQAINVKTCAAPIVEGAIAASVSAAAGMPLETVIQEAHGALVAKYQALEQKLPLMSVPEEKNFSAVPENNEVTKNNNTHNFTMTVGNPHGLHARPAATIVTTLRSFNAEVSLCKEGIKVNAKSLSRILMLGISYGDKLTFTAIGNDAEKAIEALKNLSGKSFL
ncbi:dihydroxyacetone kinase phosphoryl donor subunit DhaM [uncultured Photobacterium sp.]|uniref:dihydroxyacetone kinase phosphoryl donor subunit DhaM n=1 Tax=uncultured Photobacterium sp. TaxID=173973 RepID=UPI00260FC744|nr:dihydroxyacetone kinase phosphoryl donor subunit DhaM [uncultured Photobacterium sp.]